MAAKTPGNGNKTSSKRPQPRLETGTKQTKNVRGTPKNTRTESPTIRCFWADIRNTCVLCEIHMLLAKYTCSLRNTQSLSKYAHFLLKISFFCAVHVVSLKYTFFFRNTLFLCEIHVFLRNTRFFFEIHGFLRNTPFSAKYMFFSGKHETSGRGNRRQGAIRRERRTKVFQQLE